MPTFAELKQQRAALDAAMAADEMAMVQEAVTFLTADAASWTRMAEIADSLNAGEAKTLLGNVLIVRNAAVQMLPREAARLQALSATTDNVVPILPPIPPAA
jgi:hypothetical protein